MSDEPSVNFEGEFGACIFDDPRMHQGGWMARSQDDSADRIDDDSDLDGDTTWILNLGYDLFSASQLYDHAHYRMEDYFQYNIEEILSMIGLDTADADKATLCIARIFERILFVAQQHLLVEGVPTDFRTLLRDKMQPPSGILNRRDWFREATLYYTPCRQIAYTDQDQTVELHIDPVAHARTILSRKYPAGTNWQVMNVDDVPLMSAQDIHDFLNEQNVPMLMRITCRDMDSNVSDIINFGGSIGKKSESKTEGAPRWVTSFDVQELIQYADVVVHEVYRPGDYFMYPDYFMIPEQCGMSISYNIFATNLWLAGGDVHSKKVLNNKQESRSDLENPCEPFIRAADRIACRKRALQLQADGYRVTGYGSGKVKILLENHQDQRDVASLARHHGFLPPAGIESDAPAEPHEGNDWHGIDYLRSFITRGQTDQILEMDQSVMKKLNEVGPQSPPDIDFGGDSRLANPAGA